MDPGTLFFWRVLGGGVPCYACKESCTGVQCGEGRKCVVRRGQPKCVCSPDCRKNRHKGPVCGSDGRTYRTVCRLRKRACRRKSSTLSVAYDGHCQSSCDRIHCPAGMHCLLDQNLIPHCVKCAQKCPARGQANRHVCGTDGVTYSSSCHLRVAACRKGKAIPEAYKGRCKQAATCGSVQCRERQSCLIEPHSGAPRCVTCSYRCPKAVARRDMGGPICGTNNLTYDSWCHMLKDACDTGYVIETKFSGHCETGVPKPTVANTVLDGAANTNRYVSVHHSG
ncbi:follistatin isoform X1 [Anabrus simplex]|uniref:follistatin isoform X1 n=1 Tax=Anabrus simplex TaxID=316456 RepID=UPI0034DD2759